MSREKIIEVMKGPETDFANDRRMKLALTALESAGYAIVPVEPTEKMLYAAGKTRPGNPAPRGGVDWLGKMLPKYYRAMIAAAKG